MSIFYNTKKDCESSKYTKKQSNPKYSNFCQVQFTAGDEHQWNEIVTPIILQPNDIKLNDEENIYTSLNFNFWSKFSNNNVLSVRNTFRYIFYKFKKGIFVRILNNKLHTFLPFDNVDFKNEWYSQIQIPSTFKNIQEYLYTIDKRNKKVLSNIKQWYANNCLVRFEDPPSHEDTNVSNMFDMLTELCNNRKIPDIEFFINRRDFPIITRDETEAYYHLFGENHKLVSHNYTSYCPILSMSTVANNADILFPTGEDWARVESHNKKYFKKYCDRDFFDNYSLEEWDTKIPTAVFRGSSTGCGVKPETNIRLKLAMLKTPIEKNIPLIDVGITKWNNRIRKLKDSPYFQTIDINKLNIKLAKPLTPEQQSKYKYIIHADGHVSAFRLSLELSMGCCILIIDSPYSLWFKQLLKPYTHYIPIKRDLTDLYDTIRWCRENDDKCLEIAKNAKEFYKTYLSKKGIFDYMQELMRKLKQFVGNYEYPTISIQEKQYIYQKNNIVLPKVDIPNNFIPMLWFPNTYGQSTVISSYIQTIKNYKYIQIQQVNNKQDLIRSVFVGSYLNKLRKHIPNFQYTYSYDTNNIYLEKLNGISFRTFLSPQKYEFEDYITIMIQICLALNVAQTHYSFCHTHLSLDNIVIIKLQKPITVEYLIKYDKIISFKTSIIPVITNFKNATIVDNIILNKYDGQSQTIGYDVFNILKETLLLILTSFTDKTKELLKISSYFINTKITNLTDLKNYLRVYQNMNVYSAQIDELKTYSPLVLFKILSTLSSFQLVSQPYYTHITTNDNPKYLIDKNTVTTIDIKIPKETILAWYMIQGINELTKNTINYAEIKDKLEREIKKEKEWEFTII
jgi:hypothetical protein